MAIDISEIKLFKTANNLGGAITANQLTSGLTQDLFPDVEHLEARDGSVKHACIYIKNENLIDTFRTVAIQLIEDSVSPDTQISIGVGAALAGEVEQTIANDSTPPTSVVFQSEIRTEVAVGNIPPNSFRAIWIRRVVNLGTANTVADTSTFRITGDSS